MWLAKRPSCPAISCSWAATRLASMVAFLISLAFCFNLSSFSCKSFSFFQILSFFPLFLWLLGSCALQILPLGIAVIMINPPVITFLLFVNLSFPGLYDNVIWWAHPFKQKASYLNKMLKALSHQELRRQSRKQVRERREGNFAVGEWGGLRRWPVSTRFDAIMVPFGWALRVFCYLKMLLALSKNLIPGFWAVWL